MIKIIKAQRGAYAVNGECGYVIDKPDKKPYEYGGLDYNDSGVFVKLEKGSGAYNKAVKNGIKVYEEKQRAERMAKAEEKRIAKRRAKKTAYMKRKAEKKREEQIEIQKEAYVRALKEVEKVNAN